MTKTVDASFDRTYEWTIDKSVTPATWDLFDGDTGTSEYTVAVTQTGSTDSNFQVSGTITISNPNDEVVEVTAISDVIEGGVNATITGCSTPFDVPANGSVDCQYSADENDGLDGSETENTASVTAEDDLGNDIGDDVTVDVNYDMNEINAEIDVDDSNGESWSFDESDSVTYERTFTCHVDEGTHDNTATIRQTNQSDDASVTVNCYDLEISKTVDPSFIRTWNWTVEKSADPSTLSMVNGQSDTIEWEIVIDKVDYTDSDFDVTGTITIVNNHPTLAADLNSLVDELSTGESFNCTNDTVPAGSSVTCDYTFEDLGDGDDRENTATVIQQNYDYDKDLNPTAGNTTEYSTTEDVIFGDTPAEEIHEEADLNDTLEGFLGTFTDDDVVTYEIEYFCPDDEGDHDNTATLTGEDLGNGPVVLDEDTATATVTCSELDPLSVEKTADASFTRTWNWEVEKTADPTELHLFDGDTGEIEYTVDATRTGSVDSNFSVSGTITIVNENPVTVTIDSVVDTIQPGNINADVTCPGGLPAELEPFGEDGDTLVCTYSADGGDGLDGDENQNTVFVTTEGDAADGSDDVDFTYVINEVDEEVTVDDTNGEFGGPYVITDTTAYDPYTVQFSCANLSDGEYVDGVASYTFDNTASIDGETGELDSDTETITVYCYRLDVDKTADTSFDRRYEWTIDKSADPTTHNLLVGESDISEYTIEVTKSDPIDENHLVEGTITITNPNPNRAANLTQVLDTISPGLAASVNCPALTVPAGGSLVCSYSEALPNGNQRTNTATATLQNVAIDADGNETNSGTSDYSSDAVDVIFGDPDTVTLDSISVVDTYGPAPDPWNFSDDGSVTYEREFFCTVDDLNGQASVILQFDNTATIEQTNQSDDATVIVNCAQQEPLEVSKTVNLEFDRTWDWDIVKTADPAVHDLLDDEVGVTNYTIDVTQTGPIDSNWLASGVITITNPATVPATITGVGDVISQAGFGDTAGTILACQIAGVDAGIPSAGAPVSLDPAATLLCTYEAALPGGTDGTNIASVTTTGDVPGAATAEDVEFDTATITETLAEVEVTDTFDGAPDPWIFTETDSVGYSRSFDCLDVDFGDELTASYLVENTATITETGDSDDADVTVNCALTPDPGTIAIVKVADPADTSWLFQFDGPGGLSGSILSGQILDDAFEPGVYTISEDLDEIAGFWSLDSITCVSANGESTFDADIDAGSVTIDLAAGDTMTCTFFNSSEAPPIVIPEAPFAILFPVIGLFVAAGGYFLWRRRERLGRAS